MSKDKSAKRDTSKSVPKNESTTNVSSKKLTKAQNERLQTLFTKMPAIEKLDPKIYAKLQSTIREAVEKTVPEYKQWINIEFGERIIAEDCGDCSNGGPTPACWSCGKGPTEMCYSCGTGPTPIKCGGETVQNINQIVSKAVEKAMTAAIRQALEEGSL